MKNDKVYEVKMVFDKDAISQENLKKLIEANFENDYVIQNGYEVTALVYCEYDPYTSYEEQLEIEVATLLEGGELGQMVDFFEVEADNA